MRVIIAVVAATVKSSRKSSHRRSAILPGTLLAALLLSFSSCTLIFGPPPIREEAPEVVRADALAEAARYIGMPYEWGGQDVKPRGIDCSGLVVNAYAWAASVNDCALPFSDATSAALHDFYTDPLDVPSPGDLIFMGAADDPEITHVAIFEDTVDGEMVFIDSTETVEVDGVSRRSYPVGDGRFKSFGRLYVYR